MVKIMMYSKSFKNFIKLVSEFDTNDKKTFLKFVTGAERLPYGGNKRKKCEIS